MITAAAFIATELLALAGLVVVRRHDIARQRDFNRAVLNLVLDVGIEHRAIKIDVPLVREPKVREPEPLGTEDAL
jgi:hypothetical protein